MLIRAIISPSSGLYMTAPWWGALGAEPEIRKKRPLRRKWIRLEVLPVLQNGHEHGRRPQRGVGQQRSFGPASDGAANPAGHRSDCGQPSRAAWRPPRTVRCSAAEGLEGYLVGDHG